MVDTKTIPAVTLNSQDISNHPLTTEESPRDNPELLMEIKDINSVDPEDTSVPTAIIVDKEEPNKLLLSSNNNNNNNSTDEEEEQPDIIIDDIKPTTTVIIPSPYHTEPTTVTTTMNVSGALDITTPIQYNNNNNNNSSDSDSDSDDELRRITESNRFIPLNEAANKKPTRPRATSLRSQSLSTRKLLLVFAENPRYQKTSDRIVVYHRYGAGVEGKLPDDLQPKRKPREYLVACDFSDESYHAIEWTMGTMMRDGDKLHIVTAVNREDNPDIVKETGLSLSKELENASTTVTEESKATLGQMLLFDVELITYAVCGKVKDVLSRLIDELPLTMVVCGSRGRGTVKGILMGSISTFLVHKSSVPVTVIRPQKKKRPAHKRPIHAAPLSKSVESGQLAVDELSKTSESSSSSSTTK